MRRSFLNLDSMFVHRSVAHPALSLSDKYKSHLVDEDVGDKREPRGDDHIGEGMLLEEHRRQDDRKTEEGHQDLREPAAHQPCIGLPYGDHHRDGIVDVDAGRYIGRRVDGVQHPAQVRKYVIPRHGLRTKHQNIGKDDGYGQKGGHADRQESADLVITLFILQKQVKGESDRIRKPHQVRDDEDLAKGDQIIDGCVNDGVVQPVPVLDQGKSHAVKEHVQRHGYCQADPAQKC